MKASPENGEEKEGIGLRNQQLALHLVSSSRQCKCNSGRNGGQRGGKGSTIQAGQLCVPDDVDGARHVSQRRKIAAEIDVGGVLDEHAIVQLADMRELRHCRPYDGQWGQPGGIQGLWNELPNLHATQTLQVPIKGATHIRS